MLVKAKCATTLCLGMVGNGPVAVSNLVQSNPVLRQTAVIIAGALTCTISCFTQKTAHGVKTAQAVRDGVFEKWVRCIKSNGRLRHDALFDLTTTPERL